MVRVHITIKEDTRKELKILMAEEDLRTYDEAIKKLLRHYKDRRDKK